MQSAIKTMSQSMIRGALLNLQIIAAIALTCVLWFPSSINAGARQAGDGPTCYDESGNNVDWFIAYKFPSLKGQRFPLNTGHAYSFIHGQEIRLERRGPRQPDPKWVLSSKLVSDPDSVVMRTLEPLYERSSRAKTINSLFYNDQPNEGDLESSYRTQPGSIRRRSKRSSNRKRAHAKGVLILDEVSGNGVWLTHSMPLFPPPRKDSLEFHNNSRWFGQTFMCISFKIDNSAKQVIEHLVMMDPLVYDWDLSQSIIRDFPDLEKLHIKKRRPQRKPDDPVELKQTIVTMNNQKLDLFSKSDLFGHDMYADWMGNNLKSNLFVQSWRRGAGENLNSSCPRNNYHVNNVADMKLSGQGLESATWSYMDDHSKWAISETPQTGIVCISDINRMRSQFSRGGGAVCMKCNECWATLSNTILDLEPCSRSRL